jgi:hypothetical protein
MWRSTFHALEMLESRIAPAGLRNFVDPHPSSGNNFGSAVVVLGNGNVVITAPMDDTGATNVGAVYLYDGSTAALISELHGSHAEDQVGSGGVVRLSNENFVAISPNWDGTATDVGAVTWGSSTSGVSGVVSAANSLVGSTLSDKVGSNGVTALTHGNYVVVSISWDNGPVVNAGAVTWGDGTVGVKGAVSTANSLVGSVASDFVGSGGVLALGNGNYVVTSTAWDNGTATSAGAVTWGDGTIGVKGTVSAANSLVGSRTSDVIGNVGVVELSNGNYVVISDVWNNGAVASAGAVTWGSGTVGVKGVVSAANSLVGSTQSDRVGELGVTVLTNGNYVVLSPQWHNGGLVDAGAATWGDGTHGVMGVISAANSLIGTSAGDAITGYGGVKALSNGNYVVCSPMWDNGAAWDVGAVTWADGSVGIKGPVSTANSLYGTSNTDQVGNGFTALPNGNYVVRSTLWDNGGAFDAGAVTWVNGATGLTGPVTVANSLVGSNRFDNVGTGMTVLTNGNYVVRSHNWDNGAIANVGAATWGDGTAGLTGPVSAANSLIGSVSGDLVGEDTLIALTNGNYVVRSRFWDNGTATSAGAVTWGNGWGGTIGMVSASNSLVGTTTNDQVGSGGVVALSNGNYVVLSPIWDSTAANVGAVTWGNGASGVKGAVSASNSLVGKTASDQVGSDGVAALSFGNYVVSSPNWDNGATANAGAVTWGDGSTGISGQITTANSAIGSVASSTESVPGTNNVLGTFLVRFGATGTVGDVPQLTGFGPPAVASIVRAGGAAADTTATSVSYTVTFGGPVTGVDAADFFVATNQNAHANPTVSITTLNASVYTVTVTGLHGQGDVQLNLVDNDSISSVVGGVLGGAGAGNGSRSGPVYHVAPQIFPKVESITTLGDATTSATSVSWTVTLSAPVIGVDSTDFILARGAGVSADSAVTVTPVSSTVYTVTATGVHGNGTLALQLVDDGTIRDARGNPLQGAMPPVFATLTSPATGIQPTSLAVADVNSDGKLDLVTANQNAGTVSVLLGDGTGGFGTKMDFAMGSFPGSVVVADLNGDARPDLVVVNGGGDTVSVRLGNGNGGFGTLTTYATGHSPASVALADVNADGKLDLVTANSFGKSLSVLLGNGSGSFGARTDFATATLPESVVVADVNVDGKLDLVFSNEGNVANSVGVMLGNGSGGFAAQTDYATGPVPRSLAVADVNGDGQPDLVTSNIGDNTVSVLLNTGSGGFGMKSDFAVGMHPQFVTVSDVNGDSLPDLVVANRDENRVGVLLGNGRGGFTAQTSFDSMSLPVSVAVADVNRDGRPDLVTANYGSNNASVLLGAGAGAFTGDAFTIVPLPAVSVAVSPGAVLESSGAGLEFTFTRTGGPHGTSEPLTISFTKGGTAASLTDYTASSNAVMDFAAGTLTIPIGSSSATVTLIPVDDRLVEGSETVTLAAVSSDAYSLDGDPATGVIADNDTATIGFSSASSTVGEGGGNVVLGFTLTVTPGAGGTGPVGLERDVTFNVITTAGGSADGADYTLPALITFTAGGSLTQTASLAIVNDALVEGTEIATLGLAPGTDGTGGRVAIATGAAAGHAATITDEDFAAIRFFNLSSTDSENQTITNQVPLDFLVLAGPGSTGPAALARDFTFHLTVIGGMATEGADYTLPGVLTVPAGQKDGSELSATMSLVNDALVEGPESVFLGLAIDTDGTGGQVRVGTGTGADNGATHYRSIGDDDWATVGFSAASSTVGESAGHDTLEFTLTLLPGAGSTGPVALAYDVSFYVTTEGGTAQGYYLPDADYTLPPLVTFTAGGSLTQTAQVAIVSDAVVEGTETAALGLATGHRLGTQNLGGQVNVASGAASHVTTIIDDDTATVTLSGGIAQAEGHSGTTAYTFTATLDHAVQGRVYVLYATDDGTATFADHDYTSNVGTLVFAGLAGETKTFTVLVTGDTKFETDETFTAALIAINGAPAGVSLDPALQTATITNDDMAPTISIADTSVAEGTGGASLATFIVSLSNASYLPVTVDYATSDGTAIAPGDYTSIEHGSLTFAPGETSKPISVGIRPDTLFESGANETFLVKLSNPGHATLGDAQALGTILSDDGSPAHTITLDAKHSYTFFDHNHDKVTVKLIGLGFGTLILDGGVLDGADISEIQVAGNAARSTLSITVTKDKTSGDGLVRLGELTVDGALQSFSGPAVDFTVGGLRAKGAVKTITAHALLAGEIFTGGAATNPLALTLGVLGAPGDPFLISTPQTISALRAVSVASGQIEAAALGAIAVSAGPLAADIVSAGAIASITVRGGDVSGGLVASRFGAVSVTGGDFSGSLTSLTPRATLGATKALTSLTVTDGNLTGDIRLRGASGAITVKSKPTLAAGDITGASIVASGIASLTVARDFTSSIVLAGADLGDDYAFGGSADTFAAGTIGPVKIGRNVIGAGSIIGAGFSTADAHLKDANDAIIGGVASVIASLTVTGAAGQESYFAAGLFKTAPTIAGQIVTTATDGRFKVA